MKVMITGAGGQVGTELATLCTASGDDVVAFTHAELNIADRDSVLAAVTATRPDAVVNAAAWTNVDACEGDPDRALAINGMAVRWLVEASHRVGAHLVHISTDFVFDGELDRPYHEWDDTGPINVYGATKQVGEQEALVLGPGAAVVRTSWVCGAHGENILKTVLRLASEHDQLSFVADQVGCPTLTPDLAVALRSMALDRCSGVWHVTNQTPCTWFDLAREIVQRAGKDPAMIMPISSADLQPPRPAARPANSVLDNALLRMSGRGLLPDFRETLDRIVPTLLAV
jgi:dTDP-4-dehydrorhamnose reductase